MALFRFHRGGLAESLLTTIIVKSKTELYAAIMKSHEPWRLGKGEMKIFPYPDEEHNFDKRIGWYTHMVTIDGGPEGFLSEAFFAQKNRRNK